MELKPRPYSQIIERDLVRKLDKRLMLFAMFGNMIKTLDSTNLGSAFISGMEEELSITGLQYNWMGVLFMVGYLSMQLPSNIILSSTRPSRYLPALEIIWCVLTIAMACVQTVQHVYIIRFLLGLAEAGFFPGIVFLVGSWYTKKELGKRLALLAVCGSFGGGLSGVIQAALLKTMDGTFGVSGWRWMFLFDASITLVLACLGYLYLPDYPQDTPWLTKEEKSIASDRVQTHHESDLQLSAIQKFKTLAKNKYLYMFVIGWTSLTMALGTKQVIGIVIKKVGFDAITANLLTTPDTVITMIAGLCNGFISDRHRTRLWSIIVPTVFGLVGLSMLSSFVQPFPVLYVAFLLAHAGLGSATSIVMTWATEVISPNKQVRAMAIAIMNTFASLTWAWSSLLIWPVTDAPYYHKGFTIGAFLVVVFLLSMILVYVMQNRDAPQLESELNEPLLAEEADEEKNTF
ncbi:major facilitator superfamily domain-containing protein [Sporodiniella umbellata]|nr:major facilitator superfamily domain-containing protein [Sporodiniella umbellata]